MWKSGEWKAVCDVCGFDFLASELRENWKGQRVCDKDFETRHPQEFVRPKTNEKDPSWVRPADDASITQLAGNQSPAATLGFTIYVIDDPSALLGFTLPAANSAAYQGIESVIQIQNISAANITVSSASPIRGSAQFNQGLISINRGETHTYRCIPAQNIWYRER